MAQNFKNFKKKIDTIYRKAIGQHEDFSIEHQGLNGMCAIAAILSFISAVFDCVLDFHPIMIWGTLVYALLFGLFYFFSRFKKIFYPVYWAVLFLSCFLVVAIWLYNGGISGPATITSLIILAMVNLISSGRDRLHSIIIVSLTLLSLYVTEFFFPDLIISYDNRQTQFIDNYFAFLVAVLSISFVIQYTVDHFKAERKKVRDREDKLNAIINNIPDSVWLEDSNLKFTMVNKPFSEVCNIPVSKIIGNVVDNIWPETTARKFRHEDQYILETGRDLYREETIFDHNGNERHFEIFRKPIKDVKGKVISIVGLARDVSEKKQMKQQMIQSEKMEAIGTLAGGIAHDFNNILSGILAYAQLGKISLEHPDKLNRHLDEIVKSTKRAGDLVRQILTFSRQYEYEKQPLEVAVLLKEALKLLRATIPTYIEIHEIIESNSVVLADPTKIHQIIMNCCMNAYHSMMESKGQLGVTLKDICLSTHDINRKYNFLAEYNLLPGHYIQLEISDTGHGIDSRTLKKIFDPYFTTKAKGKGTGLGLALVRGIVEEHHGGISVESKVGFGSKFRMFLPIVDANSKAVQPLLPEVNTLVKGSGHLMVVDDEKSILFSTREILENCGYSVSIFSDGQKAFDNFKSSPDQYNLVITDMNMPKMTGDELAVNILSLKPDMPILLCTGYSDRITKEDAKRLGVRKYIQKPLDIEKLSVLIHNILEK
jgi:PAS domain S-box-containing protein